MAQKEKPKSLVTGSCGFIGTHMVETLVEAGHEVIATDLESAYAKDDRARGRFPSVLKKLNVKFIPSDMTKPLTLKPLLRDIDYLFHIAAVFNYSASWNLLYKVNIEGTKYLFEYLKENKKFKKVVIWGGGGIYGFVNPKDLPIREETAKNPPNKYLKTKLEQEIIANKFWKEFGIPYSAVRPTNVYGPRGVYGSGQMIMDMYKMKAVLMPMNFSARIPWVHVKDVTNAALFLATNQKANGEAYNLNDDTQMTTLEFGKYMAELSKRPFVKLPPVPTGVIRPVVAKAASLLQFVSLNLLKKQPKLESDTVQYLGRDFAYSNEKLKKLGYKFSYPEARSGIKETVNWYQKNGWL